MSKHSIAPVAFFLSAIIGGFILGAYSQSKPDQNLDEEKASNNLQKLADEKAEISKLDWVLLKARVDALQDAIKDDLKQPLTATAFFYDHVRKKIVITVFVDPVWLAGKGIGDVKNSFENRAAKLNAKAFINLTDEGVIATGPYYCSVEFYHLTLVGQDLKIKPIAEWEKGQLILK